MLAAACHHECVRKRLICMCWAVMHLLAHLEISGGADADGLQLCQLLLGRQQLQHCDVLVWIAANELQEPHMITNGLLLSQSDSQ